MLFRVFNATLGNISEKSPQVLDFILPKLRKVIDFLRARFTWGQNQHNQQGK